MKLKVLSVAVVGLGLMMGLTSCGHKLSCTSDITQNLLKKLVYSYEIRPIIYSGALSNPYFMSKKLDDYALSQCQKAPNSDKLCPVVFKAEKLAKTRYLDKLNNNIKVVNVFVDNKDEQAKKLSCHAIIKIRDIDANDMITLGTAYYTVQMSANSDSEEVVLTDFQFNNQ